MNKLFDLSEIEPKILGQSQKGQDSFINHIFETIGTTNKYYIEFGAVDGVTSCNTFFLRKEHNWKGLLLDNQYTDHSINLHREHITTENIIQLFEKYDVPKEPDFLCIDIDGNDYWILKAILKKYKPRVIMIETNIRFGSYESFVQKYIPEYKWNGRDWYGASPKAIADLCKEYSPVHLHLDDMLLVSNRVLTINKLFTKPLKDLYKPNQELYLSHNSPGIDKTKWINLDVT